MCNEIYEAEQERPPGYWNKNESDLCQEQIKENVYLQKNVLKTLAEMVCFEELNIYNFDKYYDKVLLLDTEKSSFPDIYLQCFLKTNNFKFLE